MISRPAIIGVVGAIVVIAAVLLNYFMTGDGPSENADAARPPSPSATGSAPVELSHASKKVTDKESGSGTAEVQNEPPENPAATAKEQSSPVFDVVRVDPEGNTVIAGRSRPNTKVRILDGDKVLGEVMSDGRGEWVFVPEARLKPGSRVLTLSSGNDDADRSESKDAVVLVIPGAGTNIAGAQSTGDRTPLAMVVPRDRASGAPTRVIQAPRPTEAKSSETMIAEAKTTEAKTIGSVAAGVKTPEIGTSEVTGSAPLVRSFPELEKPGAGGEAATAAARDGKAPVALDTVDYDDKGGVVFSGKAKPGDKVQVYVDNKLVGKADADASGRWTLSPTTTVKPGTHDIRVDKVAETGKVLARIELPFVRAEPFTHLPNKTVVIIQLGNNLWRIASRVYGDGLRYTDIFQANADQIRNADLIYPGQVFGLPKTN